MDCPFCGKEMKEGRIPAQQLKWYDNTVDTVMGEGVPLSGRFRTAEAYYCPGLPPDHPACAGGGKRTGNDGAQAVRCGR